MHLSLITCFDLAIKLSTPEQSLMHFVLQVLMMHYLLTPNMNIKTMIISTLLLYHILYLCHNLLKVSGIIAGYTPRKWWWRCRNILQMISWLMDITFEHFLFWSVYMYDAAYEGAYVYKIRENILSFFFIYFFFYRFSILKKTKHL